MESSFDSTGDRIRTCIRDAIESSGGVIPWPEFVRIALYHPEFGYYTRPRTRTGRSPQADFYTAESLAPVLRRLLADAVAGIMGDAFAGRATFVHIGAEPGEGLFDPGDSPFAAHVVLRRGDPIEIPQPAVVFANEVLDAQPFHRLCYDGTRWCALGVAVEGDRFVEAAWGPCPAGLLPELPAEAMAGYRLDLSTEAETLLRSWLEPGWSGLLLLADYGKRWETLVYESPAGTARAYRSHRADHDLLEDPGDKDLTCHVCWDRLERVVAEAGFREVSVQRQEAFLVSRAPRAMQEIVAENSGGFSRDRQTLKELLHPAHMGHAFQFLSAVR